MSKDTPIEWCDSTVNPTSGCEGCELYSPRDPAAAVCYAKWIHEERLARYDPRADKYAPVFSEVRELAGRVHEAAYWRDLRGACRIGKQWLDLRPRCIFVGDLGDVFSAQVSDRFLEDEVFAPMEMEAGRRHVWMVLTKRPSRMADFSERRRGGLPRNVIAMTSITSQPTADARLPHLLRVRARWHGVSVEPLLGAVSLQSVPSRVGDEPMKGLDWVIVGGASGRNAAPCDVRWIEALVAECRSAGVPVFVKQLGARVYRSPEYDGATGYSLPLRHKKGGDMAEWPAGLCVREMPECGLNTEPREPRADER